MPDEPPPPSTSPSDVTRLLLSLSEGSPEAMDQLMPLVYEELKRMAARQLRRERPDHTLGSTSLVHEAFLRLVDQHSVTWESRSHFFGIAAQAMRRILVDHGRRRTAQKRGRQHQVTLETGVGVTEDSAGEELVAVHEALERLALVDERQARLIEFRYFAGLSIAETAEVMGLSPATIKREWALARAWLHRELASEPPGT